MASMCSNPDCGNIRRVVGVCPECGSPAKDLGFKEGTALIKLKKENMNRREDEAREMAVPEMDDKVDEIVDDEINDEMEGKIDNEIDDKKDVEIKDEIQTKVDETNEEMVKTGNWSNNPLIKIIVFIVVVIVFYMLFKSIMG
ncbi:MAG: hypothetical protein B655_2179 [Methanobacterium sp. Maddingley MBC34]|nr:MAG: hypothetical protein B655_2179 [Methanobacterium sp. Maddingley MBC34]